MAGSKQPRIGYREAPLRLGCKDESSSYLPPFPCINSS
uniref:Uncharacterized protein n=1 Tax=Ectopseudomonas oleovorans TaxID=301 RepID=A0A653AXK1_ECTOL